MKDLKISLSCQRQYCDQVSTGLKSRQEDFTDPNMTIDVLYAIYQAMIPCFVANKRSDLMWGDQYIRHFNGINQSAVCQVTKVLWDLMKIMIQS